MPLPLDDYDTEEVRDLEATLPTRQSVRELLMTHDARLRLILIAFTSLATMLGILMTLDVARDGDLLGALLLGGVTAFAAIAFAMAVDEFACLAAPNWECHECREEDERWRAWP